MHDAPGLDSSAETGSISVLFHHPDPARSRVLRRAMPLAPVVVVVLCALAIVL